MPGATETDFFERADMLDTKVGTQKKDDPADVAKTGFEAMMRGDGDVVSGWQNKLQSAIANITPAGVLAEQHRKMAAPGTRTVGAVRGWRAQSTSEFVISSVRVPRHDRSRANYRCAHHFEKLYEWLRAQGIAARKPLHELRKELGAILASKEGIFAAQRVLRHAQISTTAAYYADKKQRISAGLGILLAPPSETVIAGSFGGASEPEEPKAKPSA
jgi:hypothetical protein